MGRKCAVPHCYTGYRKCTEKASLYKVPEDDFFLSKWQEAIARADRPITPKDYVCEKHFRDDDILRKRIKKDIVEAYQRPRLRGDAIPSIFPKLPEFILKMTKKRRKLDIQIDDGGQLAQKITIKEEFEDKHKEQEMYEIKMEEINIKSEICEDLDALKEEVNDH